MLTINSKLFSKSNIINLLLLIIPISYIAGNLIINLNIILLIIFALLFYKKKLFKFEFYLVDKLIIIFFLYIFLLGLANTFYSYYFGNDPSNFSVLIKSILYLSATNSQSFFIFFIFRKLNAGAVIPPSLCRPPKRIGL